MIVYAVVTGTEIMQIKYINGNGTTRINFSPLTLYELQLGVFRHGLDGLSNAKIGQDVLASAQQRVEGDGSVVL